MPLNTSCCT